MVSGQDCSTTEPAGFLEAQAQAWSTYRQLSLQEGAETVNGPGSRLASTRLLRQWLPRMLARYRIQTMLDVPCGDWNWMQYVKLGDVEYLGWDVEQQIIATNRTRFVRPRVCFENVNVLHPNTQVPCVDLIFCRDLLHHLPTRYIVEVVLKFVVSGSRYLITNNYRCADNYAECPVEGHTGAVGLQEPLPGYYCRPVNMEAPPIGLTGRVESMLEYSFDKSGVVQELVLFDLSQRRRSKKGPPDDPAFLPPIARDFIAEHRGHGHSVSLGAEGWECNCRARLPYSC